MNRKLVKWFVGLAVTLLGGIASAAAVFLFAFVFYKGRAVISLEFLTESPGGLPFGTDGGIFPALVGSLELGALSALAGGLIGIYCAVYLAFSQKKGPFFLAVQGAVTILSGLPSIIFGLVSYTLLIYGLGMKRSLLSAAITISFMILPFVAIRAVKIFRESGAELMEESLSLGISRAYTLRKMILPSCGGELLSTVALGMAYGMGAVAPILYTGVVMQAGVPEKLTDPFMSLPYHLYMLVNNGYSLEYAYGTAFVLMALLLAIQLLCRELPGFRDRARQRNGRRKGE